MYKTIRFSAAVPEKYRFAVYSRNSQPICVCRTEKSAETIAAALNLFQMQGKNLIKKALNGG